MKEVAIAGTQNILDVISDRCKIIFPSSHVVFESINEVKNDIDEKEKHVQDYPMVNQKHLMKEQLKSSKKNFIILRLGSVYGYSSDTTRLDIMTNLFSKIASQDGQLKLFAGGRQIKSLVPVIDVARCFKFMEERDDLSKELFNLTKDTVTVKDVAEICKNIIQKSN